MDGSDHYIITDALTLAALPPDTPLWWAHLSKGGVEDRFWHAGCFLASLTTSPSRERENNFTTQGLRRIRHPMQGACVLCQLV